jgi:hypothetical protein
MKPIHVVLCVVGLILLCWLFSLGRTNPSDATRVLEGAGYRDIRITGYRMFMASEHDWESTGFEATGPNGQRVSGAVTGGVGKGRTIRLD